MKPGQTRADWLQTRKIHAPPKLLYAILMLVARLLGKLDNTHFTYNAYPGREDGPIVMIANHASRVDYEFVGPPCWPKRLNFVVGYNEFFRFPTSILLPLMQVIPKKNFTPDRYAVREILRAVKDGCSICIMPEGMSSITGMAQPIIPGGAKLVKKLGLPVYYAKIAGGYLTYTKHCLDRRKGRVDVTVDRMFTAQQLAELSVEEIEDTMNRLLAHDDYIWNETARVHFRGKSPMAKQLETLLYLCPRCGALHRMVTEGDMIRCEACGNTVRIDDTYALHPADNCVSPIRVTDWTILERERAAEEVRRPHFRHSGRVKVGVLPERKALRGDATSEIRGEGRLVLDLEGLHFDGTLENAPFRFDIPAVQLPTYGMCTDISRFYLFLDGRFLEFYPEAGDVLWWDHLTEELHRYRGGKWQNTSYRHTEP